MERRGEKNIPGFGQYIQSKPLQSKNRGSDQWSDWEIPYSTGMASVRIDRKCLYCKPKGNQRDDGAAFGGSSAYKVTFEAKDSSGAVVKIANDLVLVGHGMTADEKLKSKLKYREGEITLVGTETEVETKVQSIIEAIALNGSSIKEGLYVGTGTFEAKVENVD